MIAFDVIGTPAPKGSSRAMLRGGHAVNVPSGSNVNRDRMRTWSADVAACAVEAMGGRGPMCYVPLFVEIEFRFVRPAGHRNKRTGAVKSGAPSSPMVKPDIDKLVRCTLDAMAGIVFDDDSRIVDLVTRKRYVFAAGAPGATVRVALARVNDQPLKRGTP